MNWWNAWTRCWYLVGEHAYVDLRASRTVSCRICAQVYDWYGMDRCQGNDMAAWSRQLADGRWVIHCGYGSDFDMSEFWYLSNYPTEPVDGICDWCIRRMVRDGVLVNSGKELGP